MEKIIIIGASGHAKVITDIIEKNGQFEVYGFVDSNKKIGSDILGYKIIGDEKCTPSLKEKEGIKKGIVAIGDNWQRKEMVKKIKALVMDFDFISAIHPSASISNYISIGKGVAVMSGAVVNSDAQIGDHCIINTKASLGHDSMMEEFSSLSSGVTIGGNVTIGKFTAISIGATVVNNVNIGNHTVIGAGALVTKDVGDFQLAYGSPANLIKNRNKGDSYLSNNSISQNTK